MFRELARSTNPAIRAGALLRLARSLRKSGAVPDTLAAYDELGRLGAVAVEGLPADLAGRYARLVILQNPGVCCLRTRSRRTVRRSVQWTMAAGAWAVGFLHRRNAPMLPSGLRSASAREGTVIRPCRRRGWLWQEVAADTQWRRAIQRRSGLELTIVPSLVCGKARLNASLGFAGGAVLSKRNGDRSERSRNAIRRDSH